MESVFALEAFPERAYQSVFLAGPTPRSNYVSSWRPGALRFLQEKGFEGTIFIPEPRDNNFGKKLSDEEWQSQVEWEREGLKRADCILFWVPRRMDILPGLTTNVEFGLYAHFGKSVLGMPEDAEHVRGLFSKAKEFSIPTCITLERTVGAALQFIGPGAWRKGGECEVPLFIWRTESFQSWYQNLLAVGNRLDGAELLWIHRVGPHKSLLALWGLRVKVYFSSENRHKSHEFLISRRDISATMLWRRRENLLDSEVVLIRECRPAARTADGYIHELPGGSTYKEGVSPHELAGEETWEETGLSFEPSRFVAHGSRQAKGTLSVHHEYLFSVSLTERELAWYREAAEQGITFGELGGAERTYIEVRTLRHILTERLVDWTNIGMIAQVVLGM